VVAVLTVGVVIVVVIVVDVDCEAVDAGPVVGLSITHTNIANT